MEIVVTGHGMDVGQTLTGRIKNEFVEKVSRYFENAIEGQATLTRQQRRFNASLRAHIARGTTIESVGSANDAHSAFDNALERMAKQLRRYKRKLVSANHHSSSNAVSEVAGYRTQETVDSEDADIGSDKSYTINHIIRSAAINGSRANVVLATTTFENSLYGTFFSAMNEKGSVPTAVVGYDLIPYLNPKKYLDPDQHQYFYWSL